MIKRKIYPSTIRYGKDTTCITEKLDGSNLGIFKLDGKLLVAQRNNLFVYPEDRDEITYGKLTEWLDEHSQVLLDELHEGSGVFGEWLAENKGDKKYPFSQVFMVFAKATINERYEVSNLMYDTQLFIYPFISQVIPDFIGVVPVVKVLDHYPSLEELDNLYEEYVNTENRRVEGFVLNKNNTIRKYVRFKGKQLTEHKY